MGTMAEVTLRGTGNKLGGPCTVLRQTDDGMIESAPWHVLSCRAERKQASWLTRERAGTHWVLGASLDAPHSS